MSLGRVAAITLADSFGQHSTFRGVVVPEATQHFAGSDVSNVLSDHPDDEEAVASKVVLGEFGEYRRRSLSRVEGTQPSSHELHLPGPIQRPKQPGEQVSHCDDGDEHEPKPEEDEDLFVEEVDSECALNDVLVNAGLVSDGELAQSDAWKVLQSSPVHVT